VGDGDIFNINLNVWVSGFCKWRVHISSNSVVCQ